MSSSMSARSAARSTSAVRLDVRPSAWRNHSVASAVLYSSVPVSAVLASMPSETAGDRASRLAASSAGRSRGTAPRRRSTGRATTCRTTGTGDHARPSGSDDELVRGTRARVERRPRAPAGGPGPRRAACVAADRRADGGTSTGGRPRRRDLHPPGGRGRRRRARGPQVLVRVQPRAASSRRGRRGTTPRRAATPARRRGSALEHEARRGDRDGGIGPANRSPCRSRQVHSGVSSRRTGRGCEQPVDARRRRRRP